MIRLKLSDYNEYDKISQMIDRSHFKTPSEA